MESKGLVGLCEGARRNQIAAAVANSVAQDQQALVNQQQSNEWNHFLKTLILKSQSPVQLQSISEPENPPIPRRCPIKTAIIWQAGLISLLPLDDGRLRGWPRLEVWQTARYPRRIGP